MANHILHLVTHEGTEFFCLQQRAHWSTLLFPLAIADSRYMYEGIQADDSKVRAI